MSDKMALSRRTGGLGTVEDGSTATDAKRSRTSQDPGPQRQPKRQKSKTDASVGSEYVSTMPQQASRHRERHNAIASQQARRQSERYIAMASQQQPLQGCQCNTASPRNAPANDTGGYTAPASWLNLSENGVQNLGGGCSHTYETLGQSRASKQEHLRDCIEASKVSQDPAAAPADPSEKQQLTAEEVSRAATHLYTLSNLIFFSFAGTLARVGLQALTDYPGAPAFPSLWFNFGGSVCMGFLVEDRMLFREEWGMPTYHQQLQKAKRDQESNGSDYNSKKSSAVDLAAAKAAHLNVKKTIPLYSGLAVGFCGSFTSFSSFIRDAFLALSNELAQPGVLTIVPRNGGYSFMAVLAVIIITVTASLSGLFVGAHLAIATTSITPSLPYRLSRRLTDPVTVVVAWGCWLGVALLTALPPHDSWRGEVLFSLLFAPAGTLVRFYVSIWLNSRRVAASFPLGTFAVNMLGTAVLGMAWDLARVPVGGHSGCQALQGVEDGFCGCLTTVSTWVAELAALPLRHAWKYGAASVLIGLAIMVVVMGGLKWTQGFAPLQCTK